MGFRSGGHIGTHMAADMATHKRRVGACAELARTLMTAKQAALGSPWHPVNGGTSLVVSGTIAKKALMQTHWCTHGWTRTIEVAGGEV